MKKLLFIILAFSYTQIHAQGTWTPLNNKIPYINGGVMEMLLLTDGTVMAKTDSIANNQLGTGMWSKLTPDSQGSYVNGTWSNLATMSKNRLYFSSQVLQDGRVLIIGGENGNGTTTAEIYDPLTNAWTLLHPPGGIGTVYLDGNSEILPDGRVLVSRFHGSSFAQTEIYNPVLNTWTGGPTSVGNSDESAWLKLPDNSILFVAMGTRNSERYIPSLNQWRKDDSVPVSLYDPFGYEAGPSFLLPDGRGFFIGSLPYTTYYTPSGDTTKGTWAAGPPIPNGEGVPDGSGAMMVNGKILIAFSPAADSAHHFPTPSTFYEFDYLTNTYTQILAPDGLDTLKGRTADIMMLDLPDGTILYGNQSSSQCYVYTPDGTPLAAGKPTINNITQSGCTFTITGTLFNGISAGVSYGDDWQMTTNRPIIRLQAGTNVYYARCFNWNRTGVQTGTLPDTAEFTMPAGLPSGGYSLVVTANGIASDSVHFNYTACSAGIAEVGVVNDALTAYPNPANDQITIAYKAKTTGNYKIKIVDIIGRTVIEASDIAIAGNNFHEIDLNGINSGSYLLSVQQGASISYLKILVK